MGSEGNDIKSAEITTSLLQSIMNVLADQTLEVVRGKSPVANNIMLFFENVTFSRQISITA